MSISHRELLDTGKPRRTESRSIRYTVTVAARAEATSARRTSDQRSAKRDYFVYNRDVSIPDVRAMTPAQRGRTLSRAVGVKRRLEQRQRDGMLTSGQAQELREARLILAALQDLEIALRGTQLTLVQARRRRKELRRHLDQSAKSAHRKRVAEQSQGTMSETERGQAREELRKIEGALAKDAAATRNTARATSRAQPTRVTSVVNGGLPGLGRR